MTPSQLLPETRAIIHTLQEQSGYPVSFLEDPGLRLLATIKTGTPGSPVHVIRYRPGSASPDYPIAFEAGLAIRMFRHAPERRFHLTASAESLKHVVAEVRKLHPSLPAEVIQGLSRQLHEGLLLQVRSCPPGILVDRWIHERYPALRPAQAGSVEQQLATNTQALAPDYARQFPAGIVRANRIMNAAYAIAMGGLLGQPHHVIPYRAAGLERPGAELLSLLPSDDAQDIDDRALITDWAKHLGIDQWLAWPPFA